MRTNEGREDFWHSSDRVSQGMSSSPNGSRAALSREVVHKYPALCAWRTFGCAFWLYLASKRLVPFGLSDRCYHSDKGDKMLPSVKVQLQVTT